MGFEFRILGPLEVAAASQSCPLGGPKQRALLAALLLSRDKPVSSDRLIEGVWAGGRAADAERSVQVYVSALRKVLQGGARIDRVADGYCFKFEAGSELDADRFEQLVQAGRCAALAGQAEEASALLKDALAVWRGRTLGDLGDEEFARPEAERLDGLRLAALAERIDVDLLLGRHSQLVAEIEGLVAEHPLDERFRRQLMLALYRSGRQPEALDVFHATRETLAEELGLDPGPELQELQVAILRQDPSLLVEPWTVRARRHLPTPATELIGRRAEIETIIALLQRVRLLTLTGPGGSGKTRLALQAAHELAATFEDGVYFVDLSPLRDPALVVPAIAHSIGLEDRPGRLPIEVLRDHLRQRRVLLVLDNFEHLDEAAPAVSDLLAGAPEVRVLVTSRLRLRLYGEHEYGVGPLSLPDEAVPLFLARAGAAGVELSGHAPVEEICLRLDCLPLAIELVAARARHLDPDELLASLASRLDAASAGPRDVPARQQTLRSTIEWSEQLLDGELRDAFSRLAVFVGGWTADASAAVAGGNDVSGRLAERNLVTRRGRRFAMLETIREYGLERLAQRADATEIRRRHADHYLEVAERFGQLAAERPLVGEDLSAIDVEMDNVRAACAWLRTQGRGVDELRLLSALRLFFYVRGYLREAREALDGALARAPDAPPEIRASAVTARVWFAYRAGDYAAAKASSEELLALSAGHPDRRVRARALGELGGVAAAESDYATARALYEEAARMFRELGAKAQLAAVVGNLGDVALNQGDPDRAEQLLVDSVSLAREAVDTDEESVSLMMLARTRLVRGDLEAARATLVEAFLGAAELGYPEVLAYCVTLAAELAAPFAPESAAQLAAAGEAAFERLGIPMQRMEREAQERTVAALRLRLGRRFDELREAGRVLDLDQATVTARSVLEAQWVPAPDRFTAAQAQRPVQR